MRMANILNDYITARYPKWVECAAYYIRLSRLEIDPAEVVNDVLCGQLESNSMRLTQLADKNELDFFIRRIIKTNICSPRSPFRYKRGQHCTDRLGEQVRYITIESADFNHKEAYDTVLQTFNELQLTDISKQIFTWRFFEGHPFSEWPGPESQKFLYDTFNRILLIITAAVRGVDFRIGRLIAS